MNFSILGIRDSPECGGDGLLAGYGWGYGWSCWGEGWVEALVWVMRFGGLVVLVAFLALSAIPRPSLLVAVIHRSILRRYL
jgi:hypothetical protein